jgi:arginase family enzyme
LEIPAGEEIGSRWAARLSLPCPTIRGGSIRGWAAARFIFSEAGCKSAFARARLTSKLSKFRLPENFYAEAAALVALQNLAVEAIRESLARNRRVLILSGNCGPAALSAAAALNPETTGVIWFDAHADLNIPETSASGFLDGMALSVLTGRCWPGLAARFTGFKPIPDGNVVLIGARDFDPAEATALSQSEITRIGPGLEGLEQAVEGLSARVENFYVHLDVDVLTNRKAARTPMLRAAEYRRRSFMTL